MTRILTSGDRFGIVLAAACALHCLAAPVLLLSWQTSAVLASEPVEFGLMAASVAVSAVTLLMSGLRQETRRLVLVLFATGAVTLLATRIWEAALEPIEAPAVVAGAFTIILAHAISLRECRCPRGEL